MAPACLSELCGSHLHKIAHVLWLPLFTKLQSIVFFPSEKSFANLFELNLLYTL